VQAVVLHQVERESAKREDLMPEEDLIHLLVEIRDLQRTHLEEYRRVTEESLAIQRQAVRRQEQFGRLYQRVVAVGASVLIVLLILLVWLFGGFN